jgi:hypothetical protein
MIIGTYSELVSDPYIDLRLAEVYHSTGQVACVEVSLYSFLEI